MKKDHAKSRIVIVIAIILTSTLFLSPFIIPRSMEQTTTRVSIVPSSTEVYPSDSLVSPEQPTNPFTVNVTVTDVTDLFAWQTKVYYNPSILNLTNATYPADNVFAGRDFIKPTTDIKSFEQNLTSVSDVDLTNPNATEWEYTLLHRPEKTNLTRWLDMNNDSRLSKSDVVFFNPSVGNQPFYHVKSLESAGEAIKLVIEIGYVWIGATLLSGQNTFSGSGRLCQFTFTGIRTGVSVLNFSRPLGDETLLYDPNLDLISFEVDDGIVRVMGVAPKESSTLTLSVNKQSVSVGSNIIISGSISPFRPGVDVIIYYKPSGEEWTELSTVKTDSQSKYTYSWTTNQTGTFELKSQWAGDENTEGAESDIVTVEVTKIEAEGLDISAFLPYIIIAIVVVGAAIGIYFVKFRKG